ncbi:urate oxidase [Mycobacterium koreense]|uniref:Uricase n=1 Tax=Mycolicibacillus koreensis TaxID=1069220 RepID=A0A7I7SB10_9MYCO|nr:urate oxidase [Mycolicibacillus koreensis]MCV7247035.1 urate oxidase [Mycolicibacillus koreensis]OSC35061.1 urate oxidase [Mycolicibacillus koreensis]BBY53489.1 uricase [Mycolicibacillus koreensis]
MAIVLGPNQYGKAEIHLVRVVRDTAVHDIRDLTVSTALRGDFREAHTTGDQHQVLPTDTQKNTVFALAKEHGVGAIEEFALTLADHFIDACTAASGARIEIVERPWNRIPVGGAGHDHAFYQGGGGLRNTVVNVDGTGSQRRAAVVSGIQDLVVLKTTGSEFAGFQRDRYTTLDDADDRVLATSLVARWRYESSQSRDWDESYTAITALLMERFAEEHSFALQQTLTAMGTAVLQERSEVAEIKFSAPNKHHFVVDLAPFGLTNPNEVFFAADRPYGLIEASVLREGASDPGRAWHAIPGFC